MKNNATSILITLALAAGVVTTSAQTLVWSDNFDDNNPIGWAKSLVGQMSEANQQFYVWGTFGPTPTNSAIDTYCFGYHSIPTAGPLPDQQTLEARVDLVSANQADASACLQFLWLSGTFPGYAFFKGQDEISFVKSWNVGQSNAIFFWTNLPVKNTNVTLVLSLTRHGSDVAINTRVLDKDNANAVLFERSVVDTPQSDPVLPNRAVNGFLYVPDLVGTPWPVTQAPDTVELGMGWFNPLSASQGAAQVIYDNLEVWQYQTPRMNIQNAVVLSWPVTAAQFVVESAPGVNGPWETVPDPWLRTNATQIQMSVSAPDSMRLFRLKFTP
jgi:hypothetical protein